MSYSVRYDQRTQTASGAKTAIVGERIVLNGTAPAALLQARVTAGSVVVTNASRTQVFIEGIDYVLTIIGNSTRVQSLLSGSILDGEAVLVDYLFDIGGTYANTELGLGSQSQLGRDAILERLFPLCRFRAARDLGNPSTPLNVVKSTLSGPVPILVPWDFGRSLAGGFLGRENRRETIAPFVRTAGEVYFQGDFLPSR
ncbi:MAG: hypothetical protein IPP88_24395 [Betaproteobacteria bacterium]|nr:hypothetical protein [Betaproteobacteria bacterium]